MQNPSWRTEEQQFRWKIAAGPKIADGRAEGGAKK